MDGPGHDTEQKPSGKGDPRGEAERRSLELSAIQIATSPHTMNYTIKWREKLLVLSSRAAEH